MFGRQAKLPIDLMYGVNTGQMPPVTEYATSTKNALEEAYHLVHEKLVAAHCRQKEYYAKFTVDYLQ